MHKPHPQRTEQIPCIASIYQLTTMATVFRRGSRLATRVGASLRLSGVRTFATETSPAVQKEASASAVSASTASSSTPAPAPAAAPVVVRRGGSTVFGRMGAFLVGLALGGAVGAYYLREEVWDSTVQTQRVLSSIHADVIDSNRELRKRVSALEQQMAEQRK